MNQPNIERYSPGTLLPVGSHMVEVIKYLTSGGFADVYSVEISPPDPVCPNNIACLKRVVVPDKASLNTLRAEVDTMRLLRGNRYIVSYIDSHATKSPVNKGMYEVYLLMEYCSRGGLIDFMNTRLQNRLQEFEVLNIMSQTSQGIAAMHELQPPLIHRDIKIENVLIAENGDFKVCDFGSVSGVIRAPRNSDEFNYVQHDIMKNTTAQYRAPEMIDLYRGLPVDEKADIWALGVFLYKLCYYTTPFEKSGESAILTSKFQFPAYPQYSDRIKNLISVMLRPDLLKRPNICQVLEEVSRIQGVPCPISNFYLSRVVKDQSSKTNIFAQPVFQAKTPQINLPISHTTVTPKTSLLHLSKSQPNINNFKISGNTVHAGSFSMANHDILTADPFSRLDKSSLLPSVTVGALPKSQIKIPELAYNQQQLNLSQATSTRNSTSPVRNGRGNINSIVSSNKTSYDKPRYVDSETQTSDFNQTQSLSRSLSRRSISSSSFSSSESLHAISTGGSITRKIGAKLKKIVTGERRNTSPIRSTQNTGDSVRSAFGALRKGLASVSYTGDGTSRKASQESRKYRNSSNNLMPEEKNRNSKIHRRSTSTYSFTSDNDDNEPMSDFIDQRFSRSPIRRSSSLKTTSSIQKRVRDLINAPDLPNTSTKSGYGKYTDSSGETPSSEKLVDSLQRHSSIIVTHMQQKDNYKPVPPPKPSRLKPKPPMKPKHLQSKSFTKSNDAKVLERNNDSSDTSDIENLEKDFRRRFPSAL